MSREDMPPATALYATPADLERPLRVVLVAPEQVPGWVRAFRDLLAGNAWIDLVVVTTIDAPLPTVSDVSADLRVFLAWERRVHRHCSGSLAPETIQPDGADVAAVGQRPGAPLDARISALCPDLVILLGPQACASALAQQAPLGCWHVDASLTDQRYAGLSLLAPMLGHDTATQVELVLQGPTGAPVSLAGSWGRTRALSFLTQRNDAFRKLPYLLLRALHRVAAKQGPASRRCIGTLQLQAQSAGGAAGLRALASTLTATARSTARQFRNRGWTLALRSGGPALNPYAPSIGSHAILKAPRGWWADPCLVSTDGRKLLFVEEMDLTINKAAIACVELVDGGARRLGVALGEPGHLSFPQVFPWQGQWYLTVESGYDRRVSLYRATDFPLGWSRVRDLVTGRACADPLLHHHDGHWYLFVNVAESGNSSCDELFLFVADSLEGPFRPHPASPIVSDVRRARMAGRLFRHQGRLIRPAQDCGPSYGSAVVFNEVVELGPESYGERPVSRLAPDGPGPQYGCHTYSADAGIEILDLLGRPPSSANYVHLFDEEGPGPTVGRMDLPQPLERSLHCPAPMAMEQAGLGSASKGRGGSDRAG